MPILDIDLPCTLNIIITEKYGRPCIELRKVITDMAEIKKIVSYAYHEKPLLALPIFRNRLIAITCLIDKGILYKKNNRLYFTI